MARQTSIEAYNEIKDNGLLSKRRFEVYDVLFNQGPLTCRQVWGCFPHGTSTGSISPRLNELLDEGVVREIGTTVDPATNMTAILWDVTSDLPRGIGGSKPKGRAEMLRDSITEFQRDLMNTEIRITRTQINMFLNNLKSSLVRIR